VRFTWGSWILIGGGALTFAGNRGSHVCTVIGELLSSKRESLV